MSPRAIALLLTCAVLGAGRAFGHGAPLPLAAWGAFAPAAARCQRVLGQAATQCALDVWALRRACIEAQFDGQPCDTAATTRAVRDARQRALDRVAAACAEDAVAALQFVDSREALADVTSICRQLERELLTAAYAPALVGSSADYVVGAVDEPRAACLDAGAARAGELLRFASRELRGALDRIAGQRLTAEAKTAVVARAVRRTARARTAVERRLATSCDDTAFAALYGRPIGPFLADVAFRASCLAGGVYVQDALRCPAPVCGNGMEEAGEECDDGNASDDDTCRSDCVRTDCPIYATTFDLVQDAIFDRHGCSDDGCHGETRAGGLDLRIGDAYDELVAVPSTTSALARVEPGDPERSRLWLLLAKGTLGRDDVEGRAMPLDLPPLSADELGAVRLWIAAGAPRHGTVAGTPDLLHACLPAPLAGAAGALPAHRR